MERDFVFPQGADELITLVKTKDFVEGHVSGPVLSRRNGLQILATVREPIEQIISSYQHIRREPANILHRPANELEFELFFETFGDNFENVQAQYLVRSFFAPTPLERMDGYKLWLAKNMPFAVRGLDWLVPCERIDEFVALWSLEQQKKITHPLINVNVARYNRSHLARIKSYLRGRVDLYDLDLLLWNTARAWFEGYRERVVAERVSDTSANDATRAFFHTGSGIWLSKGWHPPINRSDNVLEWWAGPSTFSEIKVRRSNAEAFLEFDIICIFGFKPEDLVFFEKKGGRRLDQRVRSYGSNGFYAISLDVRDLSYEETIVVEVPRVLSAIQISSTDKGLIRRSFATQDWRLAASPFLDDRAPTSTDTTEELIVEHPGTSTQSGRTKGVLVNETIVHPPE